MIPGSSAPCEICGGKPAFSLCGLVVCSTCIEREVDASAEDFYLGDEEEYKAGKRKLYAAAAAAKA